MTLAEAEVLALSTLKQVMEEKVWALVLHVQYQFDKHGISSYATPESSVIRLRSSSFTVHGIRLILLYSRSHVQL